MLAVAEQPPREAAHQVPTEPLSGDPPCGRQRQRGAGPEPGGQPCGHGGHEAHVEAAVGGERRDGQPADRPRDRAVVEERVVEPAQEHDVEDGAGEPAVEEGGPRWTAQAGDESGHQPAPCEEPPVGEREGQRAEHARGDQDDEGRDARPPRPGNLRPHEPADRPGAAAVPRRGSCERPRRGRRPRAAPSRSGPRDPRSRSRPAGHGHAAGRRSPR